VGKIGGGGGVLHGVYEGVASGWVSGMRRGELSMCGPQLLSSIAFVGQFAAWVNVSFPRLYYFFKGGSSLQNNF